MTIKNEDEIRKMSEAGQVVALVHARIEQAIAPGVTTADLDDIARETLREAGAISSFLGYPGAPGCPPFPGISAPPSTTRSCMASQGSGGCAKET